MPNNETSLLHFLIACCQSDPSEEEIALIRSRLNPQYITYEILLGLAYQHGVLPLLYKTLKTMYEREYLPHDQYITALLTEAKPLYLSIAQKNMLISAELIRIMKFFEVNNIEALAFKGPALAQIAVLPCIPMTSVILLHAGRRFRACQKRRHKAAAGSRNCSQHLLRA